MRLAVPFVDLDRVQPYDDLVAAAERVIRGGTYVGGAQVATFEREFARFCHATHCVGTSSGTSALSIALQALGVGAGDEVITPSATFVATASAIVATGARPIFADIDSLRRTLTAESVEPLISSRTRAILTVDLYGQLSDYAALPALAHANGLALVADCAQACGAQYEGVRTASLVDAACFSFYPSKNLGALGDGGAVITQDSELAGRIRRLANHGRDPGIEIPADIGSNARLDSLQAAMLLVKLPSLEGQLAERRSLARLYQDGFGDRVRVPNTFPGEDPAPHLYVIEVASRDSFRQWLFDRGIETRVHYPIPVHCLEPFGTDRIQLHATSALFANCVSLPFFPGMTDDEIERVIEGVRGWVGR